MKNTKSSARGSTGGDLLPVEFAEPTVAPLEIMNRIDLIDDLGPLASPIGTNKPPTRRNPRESGRTFLGLLMFCAILLATAVVLVFLALALSGCGSGKHVVAITGASTLQPVVERAGRAIEAKHPEFRYDVSGGGTAKGKNDVAQGFSEAGMIAVDLTPEEARQFMTYPVALDGVAVVVHASNPITAVTKVQLRDLYQRKVADWSNLGRGNGRPVVIKKAVGHGTLPAFASYLGVSPGELQADVIAGDNSQMMMSVEAVKTAIGFVSLGEALVAVRNGRAIKLLAIDGAAPSVANVTSGAYPINLHLSIITKRETSPGARRVIEFLKSNEGKHIIEEANYVALP